MRRITGTGKCFRLCVCFFYKNILSRVDPDPVLGFFNTIFICYGDLFAKMCLVIVSFGHLHITDTFSSTGTRKFCLACTV
jgi:hypothetical protein